MTDPIERVARAIAEQDGVSPPEAWKDHAEVVIAALNSLDIPIDKLLSGEMVAAEVLFLEAYDMNDEWRDWHGKPAQEPTGATHSEKRADLPAILPWKTEGSP